MLPSPYRCISRVFSLAVAAMTTACSAHSIAAQPGIPKGYASLPSGFTPFPAEGGYLPGTLLVRNSNGEQIVVYDASTGDPTTRVTVTPRIPMPTAVFNRRTETFAKAKAALQLGAAGTDSGRVAAALNNLSAAELHVNRGGRYGIAGGLSAYCAFLDQLPRRTLEYALEVIEDRGGQLELVTEVIQYDSARLVLRWNKSKSAEARFGLAKVFGLGGATWSADSGTVSLEYPSGVQVGYKPWPINGSKLKDLIERADSIRYETRLDSLWQTSPAEARAEEMKIISADLRAVMEGRIKGVVTPKDIGKRSTIQFDGADLVFVSNRKSDLSVMGTGEVRAGDPLLRLKLGAAIDSLTPERIGGGTPISWRTSGRFAVVYFYPLQGDQGAGCPSGSGQRHARLTVTKSEFRVETEFQHGGMAASNGSCQFISVPFEFAKTAVQVAYPRASRQ